MIKMRYKDVEEPAQGCVDKKKKKVSTSGQKQIHPEKVLTICWELCFSSLPGNMVPLLSICTSWKVSGLLSCWLSWDLFSPCFAPTAHCTHCFLLPTCCVPEAWDSGVTLSSLSPSLFAQVLPSAASRRFLSYFHPGLHQFLLRLLKRKSNVYYTPANYGPLDTSYAFPP